MIDLVSPWRRFIDDEEGTSTIEFVLTFPTLVIIFCASFESSFFMVRSVSLERSVDLVIRELRLGQLGAIKHSDLKKEICSRSSVLGEVSKCERALAIELRPVDTDTFAMPTTPAVCVDRREPIDPDVDPEPSPEQYTLGGENQIMLVRVCLQADPMFPTTVFGTRMNRTGDDGGYSIVTATTFVVEPRNE
jgi:Flp pilus assembly protein TadG